MSQATTGCPYANDPRTRYDALHHEPLTRNDNGRWVVVRHADAVAVVTDPETFSSHVSRFLQVPNGLDGAAHREARELLDPFLAPERLTGLEPTLERIADQLAASVPAGSRLDAVGELGSVYAVRAQSAWLGWPSDIEPELLAWMEDNHAATRSGELERTAAVAHRFDAIIHRLLSFRRIRRPGPPEDLTDELMRVKHHDGRPLGEDEIVSVLRNWTGGDLGSLALCTGVVLYWLATHPELQDELVDAANDSFDAALDEILRIDDPFVSNRRVATVDTVLNGQPIAPGEQLVINWTAANRDPAVFADPEGYAPEANAAKNLVYGAGPHVCPGRALATLELRVLVRAMLGRHRIALDPEAVPEREQPPVGGFHRVPLLLDPRGRS
ncbi:cytochrome P450 [Micropruina sp.]|uniref:cytochrome P450 n=1 Tax=Micropruina sp. TaxID=2737536 RepID=UPI00262BA6AE|nr:cytochrome P450 [Micropruina sp.]